MIDLNDGLHGGGRGIDLIVLTGPPLPLNLVFEPGKLGAVFAQFGLPVGRCFGSKSGYRRAHPRAVFMANANVFCLRHGKIWWGDLDLASDQTSLERIARQLGCRLYVLFEDDGRFESAVLPTAEIALRARWCTGGARRIPGLHWYCARAGLTLRQLAAIVGLSRRTLSRTHQATSRLNLNRRLQEIESYYTGLAANHGHRKWGRWWSQPHPDLAGKSPLDLLNSQSSEALAELRQGENRRWCTRLARQAGSTKALP